MGNEIKFWQMQKVEDEEGDEEEDEDEYQNSGIDLDLRDYQWCFVYRH